MNDRPTRRLEDIARDIELRAGEKRQSAHPEPPSSRPVEASPSNRWRLVAILAGAAALFLGGWAFGHAAPSSGWARSGVRASLPRVDGPEEPPVIVLDVSPADKPDASAAEEDTEDEGDSIADLLAEAAARAKLARADDAGATPSASATAPPAPSAPLGTATRMRHIAEQLILTCNTGHAAEVQVLAVELLAQNPPAWLAKRVRTACHIQDDDAAPPPPPP